jgi:hypothetical protein
LLIEIGFLSKGTFYRQAGAPYLIGIFVFWAFCAYPARAMGGYFFYGETKSGFSSHAVLVDICDRAYTVRGRLF